MARRDLETEWVLFLDESGDFGDRLASVSIAGLLLQHPLHGALDTTLRLALSQIDPLISYPPHATDLKLEATFVARWMLAPRELRERHPYAAALAAAEARVRALASWPGCAAVARETDAGRMPRYATLSQCSLELYSRARNEALRLRPLSDRVAAGYFALLDELARTLGPERCFFVAAAEGAREGGEEPRTADRYLALLETLFERLYALLRARPPARHKVWVCAAVRDVVADLLGPRPVLAQDLARAVRAAERFPLDPPTGPTDPFVRLVAAVPSRYDENVHPGIVLADFVSNRLRRTLATARSWDALESDAMASVALRASAAPRAAPAVGALPFVASSGVPRDSIAAAFELASRGHASDPPAMGPPTPGWAREQAVRWITAAPKLVEVLP